LPDDGLVGISAEASLWLLVHCIKPCNQLLFEFVLPVTMVQTVML